MEIKIGIRQSNRELTVETDTTVNDLVDHINKALADGSVFTVADNKGRHMIVPAAALAYVEAGSAAPRPVGFGIA